MRQCKIQGVGNLTSDKVDMMARRELKALSIYLANKRYFLGDNFSTVNYL